MRLVGRAKDGNLRVWCSQASSRAFGLMLLLASSLSFPTIRSYRTMPVVRRNAPLYVAQVVHSEAIEALSSFQKMVRRFQNYSVDDIGALESIRLRLLLLGGREALLTEPAVVAAFEVLYEDVLPVRFGGDILFNLIDKAVTQARRNGSPMRLPLPSSLPSPVVHTGPCVRGTSKAIIQGVLASFKAQEHPLAATTDTQTPRLCGESLFAEIDRNGDGVLSLEVCHITSHKRGILASSLWLHR